jgi:hypothetical protein
VSPALYGSIGVSVDCAARDASPTIRYNFPDAGAAGYEEPDRLLSYDGYGWFINANELAGVMATLRYTQQLLSVGSLIVSALPGAAERPGDSDGSRDGSAYPRFRLC